MLRKENLPDGFSEPERPGDDAWERILELIRQRVSADTFDRWFKLTRLGALDDDKLVLVIPNEIYRFWIEENHLPALQDAIINLFGTPRKIQFVIDSGDPREAVRDGHGGAAEKIRGEEPAPGAAEGGNGGEPPGKFAVVDGPEVEKAAEKAASKACLSRRYLFEGFVVGANNQFVHAAGKAVADKPARIYNPLFIHGGVGLGKTHIIQAIGNRILATRKRANVLYVSSETFTNDFIDAIQEGELMKFRRKYRQLDVLIIDDIQFLAGKERTEEEFFHTFNALFDGHKQIVLSSDRPPAEIGRLEKRLVSRFEWGLTAELHAPDAETRIAILRKKIQLWEVQHVQDEVVYFLADRIQNNVRRLEGALMRVASYASLNGTKLTIDRIENLLRDLLAEEVPKVITIDKIQKRVAEYFDIRVADMTSKRRPASIAFPRQIAMFLSRSLLKSAFSEIGYAFGGRDHGTVMHACRQVKAKMERDDDLRRTVTMLESNIRSNREA